MGARPGRVSSVSVPNFEPNDMAANSRSNNTCIGIMAHRCRQDVYRAHPLLRRHQPQDRLGPRGTPRWTGWSRSRAGITITSAATNCFWTPEFGADEPKSTASTSSTRRARGLHDRSGRSLRVLDGGRRVRRRERRRPQSETVWRQADKYHVPASRSSTRWTGRR